MNPSRIMPDLQCSLVCEEVRQEINGNFILLGIIGAVQVPRVPVTAGRLCVFNRWTAGVGAFNQMVRLLAPDQSTVLRQNQVQFALKDAAHNATNVTVFAQTTFEAAGVYYVEVLVDDIMKLRYPLPVFVRQPSRGTQRQGAPQS